VSLILIDLASNAEITSCQSSSDTSDWCLIQEDGYFILRQMADNLNGVTDSKQPNDASLKDC
jgi:hypothetical protein